MPEIIEIRSIAGIHSTKAMPTQQDIASELNERAALVKPTSFVDTANLSEGEMTLLLLAQRDKMLSEFYPDVTQYRKDFEQKRDVLYSGLHSTVGLNYLRQRSAVNPASGWLSWEDRGVDRNRELKGLKNLFEDAPQGEAVAIRGINQLDCNALYPYAIPNGLPASMHQSWLEEQGRKLQACKTENLWRASLNTYWEKSANALLYQFVKINNTVPGIVGAKAQIQQDTYFNTIMDASKISRINLELWLSNGIMSNSIIGYNGQSLGPQTPQSFIEGLKENAAVNGFIESLVKVAIGCLRNTFKQFELFVGVIKGDLKLREAVQQHINNIELFFKDNLSDVKMLASNKDWSVDAENPPIECGPGFFYDPNTGTCVAYPDTGEPGSGSFFDNLSQTQKIGLGVAALGLGYLVTRK